MVLYFPQGSYRQHDLISLTNPTHLFTVQYIRLSVDTLSSRLVNPTDGSSSHGHCVLPPPPPQVESFLCRRSPPHGRCVLSLPSGGVVPVSEYGGAGARRGRLATVVRHPVGQPGRPLGGRHRRPAAPGPGRSRRRLLRVHTEEQRRPGSALLLHVAVVSRNERVMRRQIGLDDAFTRHGAVCCGW